jgi:splicing factor U2AF subunit
MELGDRYLVVQRASIGAKNPDGTNMIPDDPREINIPKPIMPAETIESSSSSGSRILLMLNMVVPEDLVDDNDYGDLVEDIREECESHGPIEDLRIPRPVKRDKSAGHQAAAEAQRADEAAGVGRVYIKYADFESANKALNSLAGRSFAGRSIIATLLSDNSQTTPPLAIIFGSGAPPPPPPM